MISTPICDFAKAYEESRAVRLHMPGHKGAGPLGFEGRDLTEIDGADVLYDAQGIIRESEENARRLFDTGLTLYSTEGSSLCIRAMLYLVCLHARANGKKPLIAAARNAHKVFMTAAALLDLDIAWLFPKESGSVVSCPLDPADVEQTLKNHRPAALYVTSPDYLGNTADIPALAKLCHENNALLVVDNAHGAYLKFVGRHPMQLGADLCCDSAHKTLPVLTGGAYLHISQNAPELLRTHAQNALALFASTSPSYLILQSLDAANRYLADGYQEKLAALIHALAEAKKQLEKFGYSVPGDEPLKLTLAPKAIGWRGDELAAYLLERNMVVEFADPDFVVMMFTPENADAIERVVKVLCEVEKRVVHRLPLEALEMSGCPVGTTPKALANGSGERNEDLARQCQRRRLSDREKLSPKVTDEVEKPLKLPVPIQRLSPREAILSPQEIILVEQAEGRILAAASVNCPPAVPIVVCGEEISQSAIACFRYYGIERVAVVKE